MHCVVHLEPVQFSLANVTPIFQQQTNQQEKHPPTQITVIVPINLDERTRRFNQASGTGLENSQQKHEGCSWSAWHWPIPDLHRLGEKCDWSLGTFTWCHSDVQGASPPPLEPRWYSDGLVTLPETEASASASGA